MRDVSALDVFFQQLHKVKEAQVPLVGLDEFFTALDHSRISQVLLCSGRKSVSRVAASIDSKLLAGFLPELDEAMTAQRRAGSLFNPWEVLEMGRNEVRNCQVLKWLLDPRGSHGLEGSALHGLLALLTVKGLNISPSPPWMPLPEAVTEKCNIQREMSFGPDNRKRLDIMINDSGFVVIIEAKIDYWESADQLKIYASECEQRIGDKRPWLLLFVTPDGREPISANGYENRVVSLSWAELAHALDEALRPQLIDTNLPKNPGIHARDHFVRTFLKHVKKLSWKKR
jgi:hypothetical protein